jgi:hypothetical protein
MLTPHLEKLILCGKAAYNTLSIGGSQKTIFNVAKDRYIIITDITIFHHLDSRTLEFTDATFQDYMATNMLTQLSIFSDRSFNNFIVRNDFEISQRGAGNWHILPKGSTKFDAYLIHNTDISFTWIKSADMKANLGDTEAISTARPLPFDYGKIGQNNQQVVLTNDVSGTPGYKINQAGNTYPLPNLVTTNQLQFPVNAVTTLNNFNFAFSYPVANIGYVEVFEELTNLSGTL